MCLVSFFSIVVNSFFSVHIINLYRSSRWNKLPNSPIPITTRAKLQFQDEKKTERLKTDRFKTERLKTKRVKQPGQKNTSLTNFTSAHFDRELTPPLRPFNV